MKLNSFAKYSWVVTLVNMFVILWGAFVRASGSGAGCGSHWPLCNGQVVPPAPAIQTIIEFIHRITSGTALLMVIGMLVWAWRTYPAGHRVRKGTVAVMIGMVAESLAGAGLVLFHWTALDVSMGRIIVMPVHLIITFALLAALVLTAWWASGGAAIRWSGQGSLGWFVGIGLGATLILGMAGAVTALGDTVLPVSTLSPGAYASLSSAGQLLVELRVWHPLIAVSVAIYLLYVIAMVRSSRDDRSITRFSIALVVLFGLEMAAGLLNIYLQVPIWMQLTHLLLANLIWITLVLLSAATFAADRPVPNPVGAPSAVAG